MLNHLLNAAMLASLLALPFACNYGLSKTEPYHVKEYCENKC